jgi:hypothetical protein
MALMDGLPAGEIVTAGLHDLQAGIPSAPALLVSIGAPRLRRLGVAIVRVESDPEHRLYRLLLRDGVDDAHARYNALLRRLVSFERALACVMTRAK